ncbi:MAG: DUF167 domain-containing protein [Planctomycetota bacterium]|nr:MAG: DUF167 domain-containing protein [Planctomycetota bacterium]
MLEIRDSGRGIIIPVRATPGARRNAVLGLHGGRLKISVCAAPEGGKANKAVAGVLAKALRVRRSQVKLVTGETNRNKTFRVTGLTRDEIEARLNSL